MAEPPDKASEPEPSAAQEPGQDQEIARAAEYIDAGRLLPAPKTWDELLTGMVVWLTRRLDWFSESGELRACPLCGERDWEYGSVVVLNADPRWPAPPGRGYGTFPYFQVGCRACGNTLFINALAVFEPQEPQNLDSAPDP